MKKYGVVIRIQAIRYIFLSIFNFAPIFLWLVFLHTLIPIKQYKAYKIE